MTDGTHDAQELYQSFTLGGVRLDFSLTQVADPQADDERISRQASHKDQVALAKRIYALRRKRDKHLESVGLFAEPAWDMLLDLFIRDHEQRSVSISSLCIASGVPATTALRWINTLERQNLVVREGDPSDSRRAFVRLSALARSKVAAILAEW